MKEGFSFLLMNIFHSPLIRYGRGGEEVKEIHDINKIFFHNHQDLSVLESGRSADIRVP